jgi:hypothetical protein
MPSSPAGSTPRATPTGNSARGGQKGEEQKNASGAPGEEQILDEVGERARDLWTRAEAGMRKQPLLAIGAGIVIGLLARSVFSFVFGSPRR